MFVLKFSILYHFVIFNWFRSSLVWYSKQETARRKFGVQFLFHCHYIHKISSSRKCTNHTRKRQENNNPEKNTVTSNQWNKKCFTQIIRIFRFSKFLLILYLYYYFWLHNKLFDFTFIRSIYLIKELNIHTFCGRWERSFMYIFRCCVSSIQYELWAILPEKLIQVKGVSKRVWMKKCADVSH